MCSCYFLFFGTCGRCFFMLELLHGGARARGARARGARGAGARGAVNLRAVLVLQPV